MSSMYWHLWLIGNRELGIKPKRWAEAEDPDPSLVPKLSIEWDSWLRGRRAVPPAQAELDATADRVARSQASAAANTESERDGLPPELKNTPFPKYDDMEAKPGGSIKNS